MNEPTSICQNEQRREAVRVEYLNGLDYLEVSDDQRTLTVCFLGKAPEEIEEENVRIDGGRRIRGIRAVRLQVHREDDPDMDDWMEVVVDRPGDFSVYTLRVVELEGGRPTDKPMSGFDPRYAQLEFSFKIGCPSDLDCEAEATCPPVERLEPEINYLAKDYASFRQLVLDRLALIMPDWQEQHVPDLGIALVEVLAYAGDYLSYYQDAVATEAYLETARQRISVRRHARLVDYSLHEGCNARVWICVETEDPELSLDPNDIAFIAGYDGAQADGTALTLDDLRAASGGRYEVFEPLTKAGTQLRLYKGHNEIHFYTWGDQECCLPRGATTATLRDEWVKPEDKSTGLAPDEQNMQQSQDQQPQEKPTHPPQQHERPRELHLQEGDVLIFEEVIGPKTGNPADADPTRRHAVRLTRVEPGEDPLFKERVTGIDGELPTPIVEIEWAPEDALPFPLCLSTIGPAPGCTLLENVSVARGNVILADHGETLELEDLGIVPEAQTIGRCEDECHPAETVVRPGRFRPQLKEAPLTFSQPLPADGPASGLLKQDPHQALAQIAELKGTLTAPGGAVDTSWMVRRDLLGSQGQDRHFMVEMDDAGGAHLRFGDGELGWMPEAGTKFKATYRVGNGLFGNVCTEIVTYIAFRRNPVSGVDLRPRNPLPAQGGTSAESLAEARLFAPHAFRTKLQRAITVEDYARLAERHPKVQRAAATLRWTGSWYEVLVAIDPLGMVEADNQLLDEIKQQLYRYRRVGHDLMVTQARYVPLDIEMEVCVRPDFLRGHVEAALLDLFSNRVLSDSRRGFFHPDNLTFGDGIFLSQLIADAQAVAGVESVVVTKLERLFEGPNHEIENGVLPLGPLEVARLDNDPNFPENGRLRLKMRGGR